MPDGGGGGDKDHTTPVREVKQRTVQASKKATQAKREDKPEKKTPRPRGRPRKGRFFFILGNLQMNSRASPA